MTRRVSCSFLFALCLVAVVAVPAAAHAELISSNPADGASISGTAPVTVVAKFSEPFAPDRSSMQLINESGTTIATGGADPGDASGKTMVINVSGNLPVGRYETHWTTFTTNDSGVLRGTIHFAVTASGTGSTPGPDGAAPPTTSAGDVTLPVIVLVVVVVALVAFFVLRSRRRGGGPAAGSTSGPAT